MNGQTEPIPHSWFVRIVVAIFAVNVTVFGSGVESFPIMVVGLALGLVAIGQPLGRSPSRSGADPRR